MQQKSKLLLILFIAIIAILFSFYGGWKISQNQTNANYIQNYEVVKNIAELGVLEVSGVSKVDLGNETNLEDNSVLNFLKATLFERRIKLEIPFVAKYGVSLTTKKLEIKNNENDIEVSLPSVVLLSYELHLDRMDAMSRKGLFVFENSEDYLEAERLLYKRNRHQLENNVTYLKQSEQRIRDLLTEYFKPSEKKVIVSFGISENTQQK